MNIEHLQLPPIPTLPEDIGEEWKQLPPTRKQLRYIKKMLPDREPPATRGEAAVIIDVLIARKQQNADDYISIFDTCVSYDWWWDEGWMEDEFLFAEVPF